MCLSIELAKHGPASSISPPPWGLCRTLPALRAARLAEAARMPDFHPARVPRNTAVRLGSKRSATPHQTTAAAPPRFPRQKQRQDDTAAAASRYPLQNASAREKCEKVHACQSAALQQKPLGMISGHTRGGMKPPCVHQGSPHKAHGCVGGALASRSDPRPSVRPHGW